MCVPPQPLNAHVGKRHCSGLLPREEILTCRTLAWYVLLIRGDGLRSPEESDHLNVLGIQAVSKPHSIYPIHIYIYIHTHTMYIWFCSALQILNLKPTWQAYWSIKQKMAHKYDYQLVTILQTKRAIFESIIATVAICISVEEEQKKHIAAIKISCNRKVFDSDNT